MREHVWSPLALATALLLTGCGSGTPDAPPPPNASAGPIPAGAPMPADHPPIGQLPQGHPSVPVPGAGAEPGFGADAVAADPNARRGVVLESINSAGYTYARMRMDDGEIWVAGPQSPVAEGDELVMSGLMGMSDFYASSLDRTFERIMFASRWAKSGGS